MANLTVQIAIRIPASLAADAERLIKLRAKDERWRHTPFVLAQIYREALRRGLMEMLAELRQQ